MIQHRMVHAPTLPIYQAESFAGEDVYLIVGIKVNANVSGQ
jgi:hypothetical protein